jgi:TRAP-type C4-dicarboxylate transport system permease small subunit
MFAVFAIIFVNSARRYTIGKSFEWGEQLPVFLAIYGVMFGIAWAYLSDNHIRFTILIDFLSKKAVKILYYFVDLIMIGTGVIFAYSGYLFAEKRGGLEASGLINTAYDISESIGIESLIVWGEMYPYQFSMAIGGVMVSIAALLRLLNRAIERHEHHDQIKVD